MKKKLPKIKPCPAGHKAKIISFNGERGRLCAVDCTKFDSWLKRGCKWSLCMTYSTAKEAILAWNKRA